MVEIFQFFFLFKELIENKYSKPTK